MDRYVIVWTNLVNTNGSYGLTTLIRNLCILCGAPAELSADGFCPGCYAELPLQPPGVYSCCGMPMADTGICAHCFPSPPAFDFCLSGCAYRYPVNQMIKKFKYHGRLDLSYALAGLLLETIDRDMVLLPDCLLPMPLHRARLYRRGFNQATEIARVLSARLSLPIDTQLARRHKPTVQQYKLSPEQRKRNVKSSFSITKTMSYKKIAIIDDILTTGATAHELAHLLKHHGAQHIQIWCLAHAAPDDP